MIFISDRLYGQLSFPPVIKELLDCPGLLRLRDVRMANIPFWAFPSFSSVTRYEHSLGVCHLANLTAESLKLNDKDKTELMLAALYHDVATPPFAHAVEEVLAERYGFDHEQKLKDLIVGRGIAGQHAQVFQGRPIKLHKILQTGPGRELDLDWLRIANLAVGQADDDILSDLICSKGIDLDNLDNVIRAATAMGIGCMPGLGEILASAFLFHNGRLALSEAARPYITKWQDARASLYGMIFASLPDFALQTMLKDAVRQLMNIDNIGPDDWRLTDDQLMYERLMKHPKSALILKRMRLVDVYVCLAFLCITGQHAVDNVPKLLPQIESLAAGLSEDGIDTSFDQHCIVSNYYIDKRKRSIGKPLVLFGTENDSDIMRDEPRIILGVFSRGRKLWSNHILDAFIREMTSQLPGNCVQRAKINQNRYPDIEGMD